MNEPLASHVSASEADDDEISLIDLAIAPDEDTALLRYLDHRHSHASRPEPTPSAPVLPVSVPVMAGGASAVLGLFPESQR